MMTQLVNRKTQIENEGFFFFPSKEHALYCPSILSLLTNLSDSLLFKWFFFFFWLENKYQWDDSYNVPFSSNSL